MRTHETDQSFDRLIDLGHLASGVGHHVINAFSAIVSNAELLRLDPPVPAITDPVLLAETIIRTALEASTVARRLIDYARPITTIEPGRAAFVLDRLSLDRVAAEAVETTRRTAGPDVQWETELQPLASIKGHEAQLRSMIVHLLQNALEAIHPRGGLVKVSTHTDDRGWIVLEVRDSGRGMTAEVLDHAVEPFFSTKPGRLGVGLSIANGIWRRHRGTLSVISRPDEGTCLRLCIEPTSNLGSTPAR